MIANPASRQLDPNRLTAPVTGSGRITATPFGSIASIPYPLPLCSISVFELPVAAPTDATARSASTVSVLRTSPGLVPCLPVSSPLVTAAPFWLVWTSSSTKSWLGMVVVGSVAFWTHFAENVSVPALKSEAQRKDFGSGSLRSAKAGSLSMCAAPRGGPREQGREVRLRERVRRPPSRVRGTRDQPHSAGARADRAVPRRVEPG